MTVVDDDDDDDNPPLPSLSLDDKRSHRRRAYRLELSTLRERSDEKEENVIPSEVREELEGSLFVFENSIIHLDEDILNILIFGHSQADSLELKYYKDWECLENFQFLKETSNVDQMKINHDNCGSLELKYISRMNKFNLNLNLNLNLT